MSQTETKYTMAQLRATKKSLFIRNDTEFPWRLSELALELKPRGQRGSIAFLPAAALDNTNVLRNVSSNKVSISPDYEQEMLDLESVERPSVRQNFLDELKAEVVESHKDRAINAKDKTDSLLDAATRKRVGQSRFTNDLAEFTRPSPVQLGDKIVDPMSGEILNALSDEVDTGIKSVVIERKQSVKEN